MTKRLFRWLAPAVCLLWLAAFAAPHPLRQVDAADWSVADEDDDFEWDDETDSEDDDSSGDVWDFWNAKPGPDDEGDHFGQTPVQPAFAGGHSSDPRLFVDPDTYKATWLNDPMVNMPFCRVITPGDWEVSGRPIWNSRFAVKPWTICMVMAIPKRRAVTIGFAPYAELQWREGRAGRMTVALPDGAFDTDTGTLVRRYRNAETVLSEFIAPALRNIIPGLRVGQPRAVEKGLDQLLSLLQQRVDILSRTGNQITGRDAGVAEVRLEWVEPDGTAMEGKAEVAVYGVAFSTAYTSTTQWAISGLDISAWTKGDGQAEQLLDVTNRKYKVEINPQWVQAANQISAGIRQQSAAVLTRIHELSRQSFREAQEVRYKLDEKFRRALTQESVYQAADGSTYLAPNTSNYAYINPTTGEKFTTEREVPAGALPYGFDPMKLIER